MARPNKSGTPKPPVPKQNKPSFEDGVRSALIAGAVICAVVLAGAALFAVRSFLGGNFDPLAGESAVSRDADGAPAVRPETPFDDAPALDGSADAPDDADGILPELEDAINRLNAENQGTIAAAPGSAGTGGADTANPAVRPAARPDKLPPILPPDRRGILVFVIDDAGNNLRELEPFLAFPGPLSIAVLPGLAASAEAAKRVRAAGKELLLHQPMEALGGGNPGPGAVTGGMNADTITRIVMKNLDELWPVRGMNNHEGSRATMEPSLMRTILDICRSRNIYFLDSRTTADTAAPALARELNFPIASRDIFLDNEQDRASILAALDAGCLKAERNGLAIMIGHTWSPRLAALLSEQYPELVRKGFYLSTVSAVLDTGK